MTCQKFLHVFLVAQGWVSVQIQTTTGGANTCNIHVFTHAINNPVSTEDCLLLHIAGNPCDQMGE